MGRKGRAVLSRRTVRTCRPGRPILPGCPRRASDADAGRVLLPAVVRPAENTGCRNRRRERCAILPRRTVRARRALCAVLSGRTVRAGVALVSLFAPCALKRPIVDPALCYAVENINVIRFRHTDAIGIACHWFLYGRFQRGGRLIIPLHEKARASLALRTLCAGFPLRAGVARFALRPLFSGIALRTWISFGTRVSFRTRISLVALCALQWPVVDPRIRHAVIDVNVIRCSRAHAVGVAYLRILDRRLQRGDRAIIALDRKARSRIALRAGWACRALRAGLPLRAGFARVSFWALRARVALLAFLALFAGFPLRAGVSGRSLGAFRACRAGVALRPLRALRAGLALWPL